MRDMVTLKEELKQGKHDEVLKKLYIDDHVLDYQRERYIGALDEFEKIFGTSEVEIYSASGRCEVGGNHTDHQHGMVIATAINQDAIAVVNKSDDGKIHVFSRGYDEVEIDINDLEPHYAEESDTDAFVRGVAGALSRRGCKVGGFNAYVSNDVLVGAGLSSSACFEIILGSVINGLFNDGKIDPVVIAQAGQEAENDYVGKPCGLMDQMASSVGGLVHLDLEDPTAPKVEKLDFDMEKHNYSLCIVDTKASHSDGADDYASIPEEMKKVAKFFGKKYLREVDENEFFPQISGLRAVLGERCILRAYHFFEEERRVMEEVEALKEGNMEVFLKLVKESGDSSFKYLQNVYNSNHVQKQTMGIALAASEKILGSHGVCRIHGGGFAGTIEVFVENSFVDEYKRRMDKLFGRNACHILKIRQEGGIKVF